MVFFLKFPVEFWWKGHDSESADQDQGLNGTCSVRGRLCVCGSPGDVMQTSPTLNRSHHVKQLMDLTVLLALGGSAGMDRILQKS